MGQSWFRVLLPKSVEGISALASREDFAAEKKLTLRCRGPRRAVKVQSDYAFQVADLKLG